MPTQILASDQQRTQLSAHLRRQLQHRFTSAPAKPGRERFVLFAGPLVRAILEDRKTVTRRFAGNAPPVGKCPYGEAGDRLWVREKWGYRAQFFDRKAPRQPPFVYAADGVPQAAKRLPWRPSLHMPRTACRLVLAIESVHAEQLNHITRQQALNEGCPPEHRHDPIQWFRSIWDALAAGRPGRTWNDNPWVWVIQFSKADMRP